jgi:anaerobic selenocysteine-containing dehydrogenase
VEGNPAHPVSEGGVCPLSAAGMQFLYAPYRVAKPMKQTKARGDAAGFQPITWDEAITELSGRLAKIRSGGKPQGVACITDSRASSMDDLWKLFLTSYGSPNLYKMPSQADSMRLAASLALGQDSPFAFAVEKASYILSFGADLIDGWGAPGRMQTAYKRWRQGGGGQGGATVVQVESRCSLTASKADQWVAVAPGTEAAVALGIAQVMIKDKLYDAEFVSTNVFGFEDWTDSQGKAHKGFKSLVLGPEYSPEEVSKVAGVDAGKIRELAKAFAGQKDAVAVWGLSQGDIGDRVYHDLAFFALNVIKGSVDSTMVTIVPDTPLPPLPDPKLDDIAQKGLAQPKLDAAQEKKPPVSGNGVHAFLDSVARGTGYPLEVLMVHEANPAYSLPETGVFQAALAKTGYMVSFSSYMDETALQADLILPNHVAFERFDDVTSLPGVPYAYYAVSSPILKPRKETKHTGDVIIALAKKAGENVAASIAWKTYDDFLKERVKGLAASKKGTLAKKEGAEPWKVHAGDALEVNFTDADLWKQLAAGTCWYDAPLHIPFKAGTASGKIELGLQKLAAAGAAAGDDKFYLPHFEPLPLSGDEKEYPLQLVSYRTGSLAGGYLANPPFMTKTVWDFVLKGNDQFVEINPKTAQSLGLGEGDKATIKTPQGQTGVLVHVTPVARPGVVYIVQGLGHKAYDQYIQDKGTNANNLVEVQMDPVTGLGTVWATRAQLRRA